MTLSFENPPHTLVYDGGSTRFIMQLARASDAPALVEAIDESLPELLKFMPWSHLRQTVESQRERLTGIETERADGGDVTYHLFSERGGDFIGCLGLHRRTMNPNAFEIGYWIRTSRAGHGLATLATQCTIVMGFECLGVERIQCVYNEGNTASGRVIQKAGFGEEGHHPFFEQRPTDEMRANGCVMEPSAVMNALFPEDRDRLEWYAGVCSALTVLDKDGAAVWAGTGRG